MPSLKKDFYALFAIITAAGYVWLIHNLISANAGTGVCIFRHISSLPCPSCGTTTSVTSLLSGNFWNAIYSNPLGIPVAAAMLIIPFWIAYDLFTGRQTLRNAFNKCEGFLKKPSVALTAIILVAVNWIWLLLCTAGV